MQMPNKLYPYEKSTLALVTRVLKLLQHGPMKVVDLYVSMRQQLADPTDFLSVMDCLYALRAVEMTSDGEVYSCLKK